MSKLNIELLIIVSNLQSKPLILFVDRLTAPHSDALQNVHTNDRLIRMLHTSLIHKTRTNSAQEIIDFLVSNTAPNQSDYIAISRLTLDGPLA